MTQVVEDFESGTVGATVTTTNTVFQAAQPNATFQSSPVANGSKSVHCAVGTTSGNALLSFALGATKPLAFAVIYERFTANPTQPIYLLGSNLAGVGRANARVNTDGTVAVRDVNTAVWTSTTPIPLGGYLRFEWKLDATNSVQQLKVFNLHSTAAVIDSGNQTFTSGSVDTIQGGITTAVTSQAVDVDYFGWSDVTWLGPAQTGNTPPTATASCTPATDAEPFSFVTLTGTDSDSDGIIVSRQWTCDDPLVRFGTPTASSTNARLTGSYRTPKTYTFTYTVTDNGGLSTSATCTCQALGAPEGIMVGGQSVAAEWRVFGL